MIHLQDKWVILHNKENCTMNPWIQRSCAALLAAGAAVLPLAAQADDKVQKITFVEDDAQKFMASKIYELKHTKAADVAPFIRNAVVRYAPESTVSTLEDSVRNRQMLIVSTGVNFMEHLDKLVAALDRDAKFDKYSNISGNGIAVGFYQPTYRATQSMTDVITTGEVFSGYADSAFLLDKERNMFYFKDTPATVDDIKVKLAWLDKPVPQSRIELTVYEVRDSDLKDIGIDYLAWKNGPGLNIFSAGYDALNVRVAEKILEMVADRGLELAGTATYGFGGFYTAPAFDMSFIRLLQQNGKATVSSTASLLVSNVPEKSFSTEFAPEYQNITKNAEHATSVGVGGAADMSAKFFDVTITAGKAGSVSFEYLIKNKTVVERNNMGAELSEMEAYTASTTLPFNEELVIASWDRSSTVKQTIGVPILCELPVLKYIFGTTTENTETTRCIVTARAVPVVYNENLAPGALAEFNKVCKK